MPDIDANDGLARLPGSVPGGHLDATVALRAIVRYLDVAVVLIATPIALAMGAPALGLCIAVGAWLIQRVLAAAGQRWIATRGADARFGLNLVDGFGRIWLLAGAIVLAAVVGGRRDGLTAALLIFGAYSVAFATRLVRGRPHGAPRR